MTKPISDRPEPTGFDHGDPGLAAHMHETLADLRGKCPVGWSDSFGGFWTLTRYDDVVQAARDDTSFTTTKGIMIPPTGSTMRLVPAEFDPPEHTAYRKMVMPFFKAGTIGAQDDLIRGAVRECFDGFVGAGAADLVTVLADPVPPLVLARFLGLEEGKADDMRSLMTNYLSSARVSLAEKIAAATAFEGFVQEQIDERIVNPGDDRLSQIVRTAVEDHGLSPLETLGMVRLIISAGHESTVHGIGSLCYRVLGEPHIKDRLLTDPALRKAAVYEALRLDPPVMHMARTVVDDHELREQVMHAGDKVMLCFGAANRDGERFTDPDEFSLDRGQIPDVTFGNGRHRCLGEHLAIAELSAVLDELLLRIPDARIADGTQIQWTGGGNTRGVAALPVVFTAAL